MHLIMFVFVAGLCLSSTAFAQLIPDGGYDLHEFEFDTSSIGRVGVIKCFRNEIDKGLRPAGATNRALGRALQPSRQPLEGKAAWLIGDTSCPDLPPQFNGVGFEFIDLESGDVTAYLAWFSRNNNLEAMHRASNKGSRMREFFRPEFELINILRFNGSCRWIPTQIPAAVRCDFMVPRGYLILRRR